MTRKLLLTALAAAVLGSPALAEDKACSPDKKIVLFHGKDLAGLKVVSRPVKGTEVDPATVWSATGGVLRCEGKPFGYLRTDKAYANYKMHIEWRWPGEAGNSGVLLHATPPDGVFPKCIEAQLWSGKAGDFYLFNGTTIGELAPGQKKPHIPKKKDSSEKKLGEWNSYDITCDGDSIELRVNGVLQNSATKASQAAGWICLQSEGKPIEFRNWYVEPAKAAPAPAAGKGKKVVLFNGKDLAGWKQVSGGKGDASGTWQVADGVIQCSGKPSGYLRTEADYGDYVLHVEWRWPDKGGNSGVLLHAQGADKVWPKSLEAQLKSGNAGVFYVIPMGEVEFKEHADQTNKRVRGRRTDKLAESSEKKLGEWNTYEIHCKGGSVKLIVNGVVQNVATDLNITKGKIGLQSEGTPIEFRNVYLTPMAE